MNTPSCLLAEADVVDIAIRIGFWTGVVIVCFIALWLRNHCYQCGKFWAMKKTGETRGDEPAASRTEHAWRCRRCGHVEWRTKERRSPHEV